MPNPPTEPGKYDIAAWRAREHITWRRGLVIAAFLGLAFVLPDEWSHWAIAALIGISLFIMCAGDGNPRDWSGAAGMLVTGAAMLAFAYALLPSGTFLSGSKLLGSEKLEACIPLMGASAGLAGVMLLLRAALYTVLRLPRPGGKGAE